MHMNGSGNQCHLWIGEHLLPGYPRISICPVGTPSGLGCKADEVLTLNRNPFCAVAVILGKVNTSGI